MRFKAPVFLAAFHRFDLERSSGGDGGNRTHDKGFADPCLTTWPRRRELYESGRWDSNPRPSPWQGDVLPLNYTRLMRTKDTVIDNESQDFGAGVDKSFHLHEVFIPSQSIVD
jgi:hypothetical protein